MLPVTHILLTLVWAGLLGEISMATLVSGSVLSYGILAFLSRGTKAYAAYFGKIPKVLAFAAYYLKELVRSNLIIAYDILTPTDYMKPGVVAVPIQANTDLEITLLANLITMTPGTLTLDLSPDRKTLYVHAMYIDDPEAVRDDIIQNLEKRVLEILR